MLGRLFARRARPAPVAEGCRCEATIPAAVLDGFACGRADCRRTEPVRAAQQRFVEALVRRRGAADAG